MLSAFLIISPDSDYTDTSTILISYLFHTFFVRGMSEQNADFYFIFFCILKLQPCWVSIVTIEHVHNNGTEDNVHSNAISFLQCSVAGSLDRFVV